MKYTWIPAVSFKPGRSTAIKSIVLHSTDGREAGDIETLTKGALSVHWYVTKAGEVYHFVQDADVAYHAGKVVSSRFSNAASLGIEQEHFDGREAWPDVQVQAVARLIVELRAKHGHLPVISHATAAAPAGRKVDPVDYPWDKLHAFAAAYKAEGLTQE